MNVRIHSIVVLVLLFTAQTYSYRADFIASFRDAFKRYDPDSTLNGFLPFWGIVLFVLSFVFLLIAGLGLVGHLVGCRSPPDSLRQPLDPATFYA